MKIVTRLSQRIIGKTCLSAFFCGDWGGSALSYLPCLNDECTCDFSSFLGLSCSVILVNIFKPISSRCALVWSCIRRQCCTDLQQQPHHPCVCLCSFKTRDRKEITGWQRRTAVLHGGAAQEFRLCVSSLKNQTGFRNNAEWRECVQVFYWACRGDYILMLHLAVSNELIQKGKNKKPLNTLTSSLLPRQPSLLFPILTLFTSLLRTPLLLSHLCFSFFHLISYFLHLSVRSNQFLCRLSVQNPTVCLLLDQPFRRFCHPKLLRSYFHQQFTLCTFILKLPEWPDPFYHAILALFWNGFLSSPISGWHFPFQIAI